jgi:hypothetical protein
MRKSSAAGLVMVAAAASVVAVTTPALAASVVAVTTPALAGTGLWTVTPGGAVTGTAGTTKLHDVTTGNDLTCTSSKVTGTAQSGSGLSGTGIGSIATVTFTSCTGPGGIKFNVTAGNLPWSLNALSYASPLTTGSITGIHATLGGFGCTAIIDHTSATSHDGSITGTYSNSTHNSVTSGSDLKLFNVSGCLGLINSGDNVTFLGTYAVSPALTITSP